jgi:hypothetical protein
MNEMSRNMLIVSAANVECERIFNIVETLYDHRKSYKSNIFFALMMIRFHNKKKFTNEIKCKFRSRRKIDHRKS